MAGPSRKAGAVCFGSKRGTELEGPQCTGRYLGNVSSHVLLVSSMFKPLDLLGYFVDFQFHGLSLIGCDKTEGFVDASLYSNQSTSVGARFDTLPAGT